MASNAANNDLTWQSRTENLDEWECSQAMNLKEGNRIFVLTNGETGLWRMGLVTSKQPKTYNITLLGTALSFADNVLPCEMLHSFQ